MYGTTRLQVHQLFLPRRNVHAKVQTQAAIGLWDPWLTEEFHGDGRTLRYCWCRLVIAIPQCWVEWANTRGCKIASPYNLQSEMLDLSLFMFSSFHLTRTSSWNFQSRIFVDNSFFSSCFRPDRMPFFCLARCQWSQSTIYPGRKGEQWGRIVSDIKAMQSGVGIFAKISDDLSRQTYSLRSCKKSSSVQDLVRGEHSKVCVAGNAGREHFRDRPGNVHNQTRSILLK